VAKPIVLVGGGAIAGAVITLGAVALLDRREVPPQNLMGPVAIIHPEAMKHGFLGIELSNEPGRELIVARVNPVVPNDANHLMPGDRITSFNGAAITTADDFHQLSTQSKPGDIVDVGLVRSDQPLTLKLKLLSWSELHGK
jgi:S1-C subfamily serine protease